MNTREATKEYRMTYWAQVLKERRESGESIEGFCQTRGISRDRYFYWQRKLREAACSRLVSVQMSDAKSSIIPVGFAEVQLQPPQRQGSESSYSQSGFLVAEASGVRLSVDSAYPADKLGYLLRELVTLC
jgi:hypothetical protein